MDALSRIDDDAYLMQLFDTTEDKDLLMILANRFGGEEDRITAIVRIGDAQQSYQLMEKIEHLRSLFEIIQLAKEKKNQRLQNRTFDLLSGYCFRKEKDFDRLPRQSQEYLLQGRGLLRDDYCVQAEAPDFLHEYIDIGEQTIDHGLSDDDDMKASKFSTYARKQCQRCGYVHSDLIRTNR